MTKSSQRIRDAVEGRLPMEDLTDKELQVLLRLVFNAIKRKKAGQLVPGTTTRH